MLIRDAEEHDFAAILRLNAEWKHVTSPLDIERLTGLHARASYHRVVDEGGQMSAFLLALGQGTEYESPNYRWFAERYTEFLYIDRVIVDRKCHGDGLGGALYRDVFRYAGAHGIPRLVCEVDIEPLNAPSDRFHARHGFVEVGTEWRNEARKQVSLRELIVPRGSDVALRP